MHAGESVHLAQDLFHVLPRLDVHHLDRVVELVELIARAVHAAVPALAQRGPHLLKVLSKARRLAPARVALTQALQRSEPVGDGQ